MEIETKIERLTYNDLEPFFIVFNFLLKHDFPGYTPAVVNYFLEKVYTKTAFNYWLNSGWKIVFIAKFDQKIAGFAVIDKPYGGVCFCRWLGVLPEYRNKKIGKKLIEKWIDYARDYGCHKVEIASQPEAKGFYQKCGLDLEGKRILSYFGIDQFIFGKAIGRPSDLAMIKD